MEISDFEQI